MLKFKSNLKKLEQALTEAEERVLESVGIFVRGEAQSRSPVVSGAYRDSHDYQVQDKTVIVGNDMEYAIFLELGTTHIRAQMVIENSVMQNGGKIKQIIERQFKL